MYDAKVYDLRGRAILEVREVGRASGRPGSSEGALVRPLPRRRRAPAHRRIRRRQIGFLAAFEGAFRPKNTGSRPVVVDFDDIEPERIDVLVQMREMTMRFDDVRIRGGGLEARLGRVEIDADAVAESGGRLQPSTRCSPERNNAAAGARSSGTSRGALGRGWPATRRTPPCKECRGLLDVNYERLVIDSLKWRGEVFQFDRLLLEGDALGFDAAGAIQPAPRCPSSPTMSEASPTTKAASPSRSCPTRTFGTLLSRA